MKLSDFENATPKATIAQLYNNVRARTYRYILARDEIYKKCNLAHFGSPSTFQTLLATRSSELRFNFAMESAIEDGLLSGEEGNRILALFHRMVDAKKAYEYANERESR